ncbi:MAG: FAD-dependent oxidoreductase [Gammaproteobacteria bacterium]|nr:FAD-dependent oxidoreductase [Gammaproteobacteria bacterium]
MSGTASGAWDHEFDVVVVGSGAGGMTAALCAAQLGLSAVVLEKSDRYGGTSAVSGGGIWIPCNDQIAARGGSDSEAEALTYLNHLTGGEVPQTRLQAYVRHAREMVRHMAQAFGVRFESVARYPDYFPDRPGGKPGYRTMEPAEFDGALLGAEFERQREPYRGTLVMGRIAMTQVEAHTLLCRGPGWVWLTVKMLLRYWLDFGWRRRTWRDRRQTLGQAMVASLRYAMLRNSVPLWLETGLDSPVEENGRVAGVVAGQRGRTLRIRARRGVVLACGGFESNQAMREQYLPKPTRAEWTVAPGINHGDGIRAGRALGARLGFMNLTWGTPSIMTPGARNATGIFMERQLPGCVMVDGQGRRFVNEAAPYTEIVYAMYRDHEKSGGAVPCWLIFDADFRRKYPMGPMLPGSIQPDARLPRDWLGKVYWRADSLDALAREIGVDAPALAETVAKMNRYAADGVDPEHGKGNNAFDRYYGDPGVKPNPCLAPIARPPFYAVQLQAGEIGTKGGLVTDEHARVLREDGSRIEGLYAVGNCSAAVMGRTYAGPGATLGPAMTFAYLAAQDLGRASAGTTIAAAA